MTDKPILFVGDNPDDVALTLRALRQDNILNQVVIARDGVEALDYSFGTGVHQGRNADDKPALVLLDLKPPKVDGLEVIVRSERSNARGCSRWSSSPPPSRKSNLLNAYELGANAHVRKPVGFIRFAEAVRQFGPLWLVLNEAPSNRRPC